MIRTINRNYLSKLSITFKFAIEMKSTIEKAVAEFLVVWAVDMLAILVYYGLYKAWWLGGVEA
jgi:hypothetical protein